MTKTNQEVSSPRTTSSRIPRNRPTQQQPRDAQNAQSAGSDSQRTASNAAFAPHQLMTPEANVQRIMWTGTIWFVAAVGAVAIALGLLLSSGWRPDVLSGGVEVLWWSAFGVVALSVGLIGWSGCPILEVDVPTADRNKTWTMQLGTMLFIVGGAAGLLAVLLGPAA